MGQISTVYKLPNNLSNKIMEMLNEPALMQTEIVKAINDDAGKPVLSKSALNRFVKNMEKNTGRIRRYERPDIGVSLAKIADALDRIAISLEKQHKKSN